MNRFQPPMSPYLWAAGPAAAQLAAPNVIAGRYKVINPQVWQDVYPERLPAIPNPLPAEMVAYLRLYPQRLHVPSVYGVCYLENAPVILLQDAPIDSDGHLLPALLSTWSQASALRQVYWLWQMLQLWQPLAAQGATAALLDSDNLRVEGWRLRLRELSFAAEPATLQQLGQSWRNLAQAARAGVAPQLDAIVSELQRAGSSDKVAQKALNKLLLIQAAQQSLRSHIASATDSGPQHERNEDACYPPPTVAVNHGDRPDRNLTSHFAIVCDGIGGHEGGEVASQLAVQSLQLQAQAFLQEIPRERELLSPDLVEDHLKAILRIANNLICSRNDAQGREARQRMATTVIMAIQVPQAVPLNDTDFGNGRELYVLHVGDSRAYWLTERYCQQLTVDDDVANREIRLARSLPIQAAHRPDAGALTQALGTREAERLRPNIQRFTIDEDGVLLLCSDGLSDNFLIERSWQEFVPDILRGKLSLAAAADLFVKLANQRNGHDNTTVVAIQYSLTADEPVMVTLADLPEPLPADDERPPETRSPAPDLPAKPEPESESEPHPEFSLDAKPPSEPVQSETPAPRTRAQPDARPEPTTVGNGRPRSEPATADNGRPANVPSDNNGSPPSPAAIPHFERPVPPPMPPEESRVPPDTLMTAFEDVDLDEEILEDHWLDKNYRRLAMGAGAAVLAIAITLTGWFVWSRLNQSEPLPLPGPANEEMNGG